MGILDEIQKTPVIPGVESLTKADLIARIRQTYPAAVQAARQVQQAPTPPTASPMVPNHKEAGPTPASPPDAKLAPFATTVWEPPGFRGPEDPGGYFFDESVSQAERKEFVEAVDWFDRADARKKQEAEKNSARQNFKN
jgi:hypothetical protein